MTDSEHVYADDGTDRSVSFQELDSLIAKAKGE